MTILWHCRGCNEKGEQTVKIDFSAPLSSKNIIDIVAQAIEHQCEDRNIGVAVKTINRQE